MPKDRYRKSNTTPENEYKYTSIDTVVPHELNKLRVDLKVSLIYRPFHQQGLKRDYGITSLETV